MGCLGLPCALHHHAEEQGAPPTSAMGNACNVAHVSSVPCVGSSFWPGCRGRPGASHVLGAALGVQPLRHSLVRALARPPPPPPYQDKASWYSPGAANLHKPLLDIALARHLIANDRLEKYNKTWLVCIMRNMPCCLMRDKTGVLNGGAPVYPTVDLAGKALHVWPVEVTAAAGLNQAFQVSFVSPSTPATRTLGLMSFARCAGPQRLCLLLKGPMFGLAL